MVADAALVFLTHFAIILTLGIISTIIARMLRLPSTLLYIISGMMLGMLAQRGVIQLSFPELFIATVSIFALAIVLFDACSHFKWYEFDTHTFLALKHTGIFIALCFIVLTPLLMFLFPITQLYLAFMFSGLMIGTSPDAMLSLLKGKPHRVIEFLKLESTLNTPLVVILPFLVLELHQLGGGFLTPFVKEFSALALTISISAAVSIVLSLIVFKLMKKYYSESLSPLVLITVALLSYVLGEQLGGNGVLSVTIMGLFFGNSYIKHPTLLREFSKAMSTFFVLLFFILLGIYLKIPTDFSFFLTSLVLFIVYLCLRYLSTVLTFHKSTYSFKEQLFITLNVPKGFAVAITLLSLNTFAGSIPELGTILKISTLLIIYKLLLSTIITRNTKFFLGETL